MTTKKSNENSSSQTFLPSTHITKQQITDIIYNLSGVPLSNSEISVLSKGLNFCPTTKDPNYEEILDDMFSFCRKQRLKHHFHNKTITKDNNNNKK